MQPNDSKKEILGKTKAFESTNLLLTTRIYMQVACKSATSNLDLKFWKVIACHSLNIKNDPHYKCIERTVQTSCKRKRLSLARTKAFSNQDTTSDISTLGKLQQTALQ
jgi:hypothetical protein